MSSCIDSNLCLVATGSAALVLAIVGMRTGSANSMRVPVVSTVAVEVAEVANSTALGFGSIGFDSLTGVANSNSDFFESSSQH